MTKPDDSSNILLFVPGLPAPVGLIMVDEEMMRLVECPDCGAHAVERNTAKGWQVYCPKGCNGRLLGVEAKATCDSVTVAALVCEEV